MRYTMKRIGSADTSPFVLYPRGKLVGRIAPHASGGFVARIGKTHARGASEHEAFERVAADALGFESPDHLRQHNRQVSAIKRERNDRARAALNEMMRGNYAPLVDLLGKL